MNKVIPSSIRNNHLLAEGRQQIFNTAAKLIMVHGFEKTSMSMIAEANGQTVGALYRYISSKEDLRLLTLELGELRQKELNKKLQERTKGLDPIDALKESIAVLIKSRDETHLIQNMAVKICSNASREIRQRHIKLERDLIEIFTRLLDDAMKAGDLEIKDTFIIAQNIVSAADSWVARSWIIRKRYTLEEYIKAETNFILECIKSKRI
jgi:TetR/AcrR family transcriptional regulator, cholesterol catabolism regulator